MGREGIVVRYRVEVADRADGRYAVRDGQVFHAERSTTDATVLLATLPESEPPADFDTEWHGRAARVVSESEVDSTLQIRTFTRYDDEYYRIEPHPAGDELRLRWTGVDETLSTQLGLVDGATTVDDVESLTALWQERHDRPGREGRHGESRAKDSTRLLRAIGHTLLGVLPRGWQRAAAQFRQIGEYSEIEVRAVGTDDDGHVVVALSAPAQLGQLFTELRAAMYENGKGTWLQGTFHLDNQSHFDFDYDNSTEPDWRLGPGFGGRTSTRGHENELERFPRDRGDIPTWLAAKAGLPVETSFHHARVVDGHTEGHPPVVNRAQVPQDELRTLLSYLYGATVVLSRPGPRADIFAPNAAPDVPDAFHSDGVWIWPAAVPHYLRKYGLPPDDELLAHIRRTGPRPPYVDKTTREAVRAELEGTPAPRQTDPNAERSIVTRIDRGADPSELLRASEVLTVLQQRLAEQGVAESTYRIGEPANGVWCLHKTSSGWEVARYADGEPVDAQYFDRVEAAARSLLGTLLLYPGRAAAGRATEADPDEPASHASDWPILPLRGEPPLNFFHDKRVTALRAGTMLRRFGNESGNLLHPVDTEFPETALPFEREHEQHTYVLLRPLWALTGVTVAWNGLPGGALAHLLPTAVGQHVGTGALERR